MDTITNLPKANEPVEIKVRPRYYDRTAVILNAVPNPISAEDPLYNREEIFRYARRKADKLWVINDGKDDLFVRFSSGTDGPESFSDENKIYPGDYKVYYNVFELRLRSPLAGLPYRVSENEIQRGCCPTGGGVVSVSGSIVQISGQIVQISGQQVEISGQPVTVSGNVIFVTNLSGQTLNVNISGLTVSISGATLITTVSGDIVQISG
ncbi:MAG: hypothetical protein ABSF14_23845, partial [Terriglobia bacterium]